VESADLDHFQADNKGRILGKKENTGWTNRGLSRNRRLEG